MAGPALAAPVWTGDIETGDLSQWDGQLNGEHIMVVGSPVLQGKYAAQIQLTNDAVWPNGLKRVELHHSPGAGRTAEGASLYFAWSFYVPEKLPTDPSQQIGYWESDQSYQQMMAFEVAGEHISFSTRKPQNVVQWEADGKVTAAAWHRVAIHVNWSKDPAKGSVDVWFDGEQVVTNGPAQTLADDNSHFTQVGLLRGKVEFQDSPLLFIDDAVEGDSLADVHPELPSGAGGGGAGGGGAGGDNQSGAGGATASASASSGTASSGGSASGGGSTSDGDCGCRAAGAPTDSGIFGIAAAISALALVRRRRRLRQSI